MNRSSRSGVKSSRRRLIVKRRFVVKVCAAVGGIRNQRGFVKDGRIEGLSVESRLEVGGHSLVSMVADGAHGVAVRRGCELILLQMRRRRRRRRRPCPLRRVVRAPFSGGTGTERPLRRVPLMVMRQEGRQRPPRHLRALYYSLLERFRGHLSGRPPSRRPSRAVPPKCSIRRDFPRRQPRRQMLQHSFPGGKGRPHIRLRRRERLPRRLGRSLRAPFSASFERLGCVLSRYLQRRGQRKQSHVCVFTASLEAVGFPCLPRHMRRRGQRNWDDVVLVAAVLARHGCIFQRQPRRRSLRRNGRDVCSAFAGRLGCVLLRCLRRPGRRSWCDVLAPFLGRLGCILLRRLRRC